MLQASTENIDGLSLGTREAIALDAKAADTATVVKNAADLLIVFAPYPNCGATCRAPPLTLTRKTLF
jgi:hypothetical protein